MLHLDIVIVIEMKRTEPCCTLITCIVYDASLHFQIDSDFPKFFFCHKKMRFRRLTNEFFFFICSHFLVGPAINPKQFPNARKIVNVSSIKIREPHVKHVA